MRTIIDDGNFYDQLKLFAKFTRLAGFQGLIICLDGMANLYKLANSQARASNYEQILRILNDCLQGSVEGLGVVMAGTPDFLLDPRRGLYSYQALQSRLGQNPYAKNGLVDFSSPILRLGNLTPEDLYVLLFKLRDVFAWGDSGKYLVPDEGLQAFMEHCAKRIGEAYFRTPRTTIVAFLNFLAILDRNPGTEWRAILGDLLVEKDQGPPPDNLDSSDHVAKQPGDGEVGQVGELGGSPS